MEHTICIDLDGSITMIYSDEARGLLELGPATIERVSAVEPGADNCWYANMRDGTILGPYDLREDALAAEVAYLKEKLF